MMKKSSWTIGFLCGLLFLTGCSTVPIIGRKQAVVPDSVMIPQSIAAYESVRTNSTVLVDTPEARLVAKVGHNIAAAVEQYMQDHGQGDQLAGYSWEFMLIDEDIPNAWCMPGGKVAFYTGILPFTKSEAGMAVVMGHEVAHAIAKHGNERMASQLGQQGIGALLSWGTKDTEYHDMLMMTYGVGSQYLVMLPYSRMHESEADRMGLIFMAMAGYDPNEAVAFWERMSAGNSDAPPEFMSTHPSDETRIAKLKELIPEAMRYYKK